MEIRRLPPVAWQPAAAALRRYVGLISAVESGYGIPKIRLGIHRTIPGTKISSSVTAETAIRNGVDSRV